MKISVEIISSQSVHSKYGSHNKEVDLCLQEIFHHSVTQGSEEIKLPPQPRTPNSLEERAIDHNEALVALLAIILLMRGGVGL